MDKTAEGIMIFKAYIAIAKWLRLERELDHIQVYRQAMRLCASVIQNSYGLSLEQLQEPSREGIETANYHFKELGEVGFRTFMKSLGVAGMGDVLSPEGTGDLIALLRIFLRVVIEYEPEEVVDKYAKDIKTTCFTQLEGEDVWAQLEEFADSIFEENREALLKAHPISGQ